MCYKRWDPGRAWYCILLSGSTQGWKCAGEKCHGCKGVLLGCILFPAIKHNSFRSHSRHLWVQFDDILCPQPPKQQSHRWNWKCCHFDGIFIFGCTVSLWWEFHQSGILISVMELYPWEKYRASVRMVWPFSLSRSFSPVWKDLNCLCHLSVDKWLMLTRTGLMKAWNSGDKLLIFPELLKSEVIQGYIYICIYICIYQCIRSELSVNKTHWGLNGMAALLQPLFSNVFSQMKINIFSLKSLLRFFLRIQWTIH